jgi:uncharacterized protein YfcZ (UPF0381/DUF406 family)
LSQFPVNHDVAEIVDEDVSNVFDTSACCDEDVSNVFDTSACCDGTLHNDREARATMDDFCSIPKVLEEIGDNVCLFFGTH